MFQKVGRTRYFLGITTAEINNNTEKALIKMGLQDNLGFKTRFIFSFNNFWCNHFKI